MGYNHGKVMSIKVDGLDKLVSDLKKFGNDGERIVKRELEDTATNISLKATNRAPGAEPFNIKQRILAEPSNGGLSWQVGVQGTTEFDVWVEFGQGLDPEQLWNSPAYSQEVKDLAKEFIGKIRPGTGTLRNQAYLFPSFYEESPKLIQNLKRELENLANKS
jgi:hypothetical protein